MTAKVDKLLHRCFPFIAHNQLLQDFNRGDVCLFKNTKNVGEIELFKPVLKGG